MLESTEAGKVSSVMLKRKLVSFYLRFESCEDQ